MNLYIGIGHIMSWTFILGSGSSPANACIDRIEC